eukprot:366521-Chlamydomonas_euryale.AAC.12
MGMARRGQEAGQRGGHLVRRVCSFLKLRVAGIVEGPRSSVDLRPKMWDRGHTNCALRTSAEEGKRSRCVEVSIGGPRGCLLARLPACLSGCQSALMSACLPDGSMLREEALREYVEGGSVEGVC